MIDDNTFKLGFGVKGQTPTNVVIADIQVPGTAGDPEWTLAEWYSQTTMAYYSGNWETITEFKWADAYKAVYVSTNPSNSYDLRLAINADNEYGGVYRTANDPWPHLLVGQRVNKSHHQSLGEMTSLKLKFDAKLHYHNPNIKAGYNPSIHAAQFVMFYTVQNLNTSSAGYGDYLWLGIPIFDSRYPTLTQSSHIDGGNPNKPGTGKLIYRLASSSVTTGTLHGGNWTAFDTDLLPLAKGALDYAWENDLLQDSTSYNDYYIGGMNSGWEVPGLDIATVDLKNLKLDFYSPEFPPPVGC
tara:strand:- start:1139 stop:2035 length:897 start_codon:yes stop_codon:yes gene_type:complete